MSKAEGKCGINHAYTRMRKLTGERGERRWLLGGGVGENLWGDLEQGVGGLLASSLIRVEHREGAERRHGRHRSSSQPPQLFSGKSADRRIGILKIRDELRNQSGGGQPETMEDINRHGSHLRVMVREASGQDRQSLKGVGVKGWKNSNSEPTLADRSIRDDGGDCGKRFRAYTCQSSCEASQSLKIGGRHCQGRELGYGWAGLGAKNEKTLLCQKDSGLEGCEEIRIRWPRELFAKRTSGLAKTGRLVAEPFKESGNCVSTDCSHSILGIDAIWCGRMGDVGSEPFGERTAFVMWFVVAGGEGDDSRHHGQAGQHDQKLSVLSHGGEFT